MIKALFILLIGVYQRFLSPIKGFNCAHHRLHRGDTCSNAIKKIIKEHPLIDLPKLSRERFRECKSASIELASQQARMLHRADLPCDIGCIDSAGCVDNVGCFGDAQSPDRGNSLSHPCDLCIDFPRLKRRTQIIILVIIASIGLATAYYYGSQITKLEVSQLASSQRSDGLFEKLLSRDAPSLRAVAITQSQKFYSPIVEGSGLQSGGVLILSFPSALPIEQLSRLELQDARFSVARNLVVVGQTIEIIEQPDMFGNGKRFKYRFKSRWGF